MAQHGYRFKKDGAWYLRYRDNFSEGGKIVRKQKCVKLAEYSDRYRRESDLDDLVAEKMAGVRQAAKCAHSCDSFATFVDDTYLPYVRENKKASTAAGYRSYWLSYIKPRTAHLALRDFTMAITSNLLSDIAAACPLNVETIGKIRSILSGIFTYALATGAFSRQERRRQSVCRGATAEGQTKGQNCCGVCFGREGHPCAPERGRIASRPGCGRHLRLHRHSSRGSPRPSMARLGSGCRTASHPAQRLAHARDGAENGTVHPLRRSQRWTEGNPGGPVEVARLPDQWLYIGSLRWWSRQPRQRVQAGHHSRTLALRRLQTGGIRRAQRPRVRARRNITQLERLL